MEQYNLSNIERMPSHVAIIMDGNGRYAKKRHMPRSFGHAAGAERVHAIVKMSSDIGIKALTLYAFSTENWARPEGEVTLLMQLILDYLKKEIKELQEENVRFRVIGKREGLPKEVIAAIDDAEEKTKQNTGLMLSIAINYGGRDEIFEAAKQFAIAYREKEAPLTKEAFESCLYTSELPEPDLLIRTSGELRLSNFLLYQLAYAELYFTDVYWPDFDETEFLKALEDFSGRKRRFGGLT